MVNKDATYKLAFMNLEINRKKKSAEHNKVVNKYSKHIEDVKTMRNKNISMRKISESLNIPFSGLRRLIHRDLQIQ